MFQIVVDNINWRPYGSKRYLVLQLNEDSNLNNIISILLEKYLYNSYSSENLFIHNRNWWGFFYFVSYNNTIIKENNKPLWLIEKKYNLKQGNTIDLLVKTNSPILLVNKIKKSDRINMINYHRILPIIFKNIPREIIYNICNYVY